MRDLIRIAACKQQWKWAPETLPDQKNPSIVQNKGPISLACLNIAKGECGPHATSSLRMMHP